MKTPTLDPTKLTSEQRDKLEAYQQTQEQLKILNDIADISQEMLNVADRAESKNTKQLEALGAVLTDSREQLVKLTNKEAPEAPDYAKPVVEAVKKLETAIKAIEVKPQVKVDAPQVNVAPSSIDLKGIEKIIKTDIPKAFEKAISLIPKTEIPETDNSALLEAWEGISEQLVSIENATRMKPLPGSIIVSNLGEVVSAVEAGEAALATRLDDSADPVLYVGKAPVGSVTSSAVWQVAKLDTTSGLVKTFADGDAGFDNVWDDRTSLTYQ